MNVSQRISRIVGEFQEKGIRKTWSRILWDAHIYRRVLLMERSLDETYPEVVPRMPVVFDRLKETEVDEYIRFSPTAHPSVIRARLDRGDQCFVARHAGQIVNAGWASTSSTASISELRREIKLAPGEVFLFEGLTDPHFRSQKIQQARHSWMLRILRDAGFRRAIGHVRLDNSAQIRALESVGYHSFAVMGYVKLGRWRHNFSGPLPPP